MTLVGAVPTSDRSEVRVMRGLWDGREVVDLRVWVRPIEGGEHRPTPRGVRILPDQVPELLAALKKAGEPNEKRKR